MESLKLVFNKSRASQYLHAGDIGKLIIDGREDPGVETLVIKMKYDGMVTVNGFLIKSLLIQTNSPTDE